MLVEQVWLCAFLMWTLGVNEVQSHYQAVSKPDCAPHLWRCTSGECITKGHKCDGQPDCDDASDELECPAKPRVLPPGEKRCPDTLFECKSGECIRKNRKCDGRKHCLDGSDEDGCASPTDGANFRCPHGLFTCANTECILERLACDGEDHCADGSDEWNCGRNRRERDDAKSDKEEL